MDAPAAQETPLFDTPRNLYFGAEDWLAKKPGMTEQELGHIKNQRHGLVAGVAHKAEKLIAATGRSTRDFDQTGTITAVLDHIEALRDDLFKLTNELVRDIENADARYTDVVEARVHRDITAARGAADGQTLASVPAPTPKPGPGPIVVHISPSHDLTAAAARITRDNLIYGGRA